MHFRHAGPADPRAIWPFLLFAYGALATVLPWMIAISSSLVLDEDLSLQTALVIGILVALPFWFASRTLAHTPYHALGTGYIVLLGLYGCYVIAVVVAGFRSRAAPS